MTKIRLTRTFNSLFGAVAIVGLFVIGTNAYAQQEEIDQLFQLAEQGNAWAQHNLGVLYSHGDGVAQNKTEAAKWYHLAAEQGMADSQYNLGLMYTNGEGVAQDLAEAAKWYRLAAEQSKAEAQVNLGIVYQQGEALAQSNLGRMYTFGEGVPRNDVEAAKWLRLAGRTGSRRGTAQPWPPVSTRSRRAARLCRSPQMV